MLDRAVEYSEQATYCRERAGDAPTEKLRKGWRDLGEKWRQMAAKAGSGGIINGPTPKA